jgi:hypothetical protein
MQMSRVVEELRADALAVGELGDELVAEVAERIANVLVRSTPGRVLDLLSELAAQLSDDLPEGRVEVRVAGDDVDLAYVDERSLAPIDGGDLSARITLRLSEQLKSRVEEHAAGEGVSVNAFILRALERGTAASRPRVGSRLRGFGTG